MKELDTLLCKSCISLFKSKQYQAKKRRNKPSGIENADISSELRIEIEECNEGSESLASYEIISLLESFIIEEVVCAKKR